jgi:hypothetical protein
MPTIKRPSSGPSGAARSSSASSTLTTSSGTSTASTGDGRHGLVNRRCRRSAPTPSGCVADVSARPVWPFCGRTDVCRYRSCTAWCTSMATRSRAASQGKPWPTPWHWRCALAGRGVRSGVTTRSIRDTDRCGAGVRRRRRC